MAAALYLLVLPQPWVVRVDTRAMWSTASCVAAAVLSFGSLCFAVRLLHRPFLDAGGKFSMSFVLIFLFYDYKNIK